MGGRLHQQALAVAASTHFRGTEPSTGPVTHRLHIRRDSETLRRFAETATLWFFDNIYMYVMDSRNF